MPSLQRLQEVLKESNGYLRRFLQNKTSKMALFPPTKERIVFLQNGLPNRSSEKYKRFTHKFRWHHVAVLISCAVCSHLIIGSFLYIALNACKSNSCHVYRLCSFCEIKAFFVLTLDENIAVATMAAVFFLWFHETIGFSSETNH